VLNGPAEKLKAFHCDENSFRNGSQATGSDQAITPITGRKKSLSTKTNYR
jgi:hypothetical protein